MMIKILDKVGLTDLTDRQIEMYYTHKKISQQNNDGVDERYVPCDLCGGTGRDLVEPKSFKCPRCNGTGIVKKQQ